MGFGMMGGMVLFWLGIIFLAVLFVNSLFQIKNQPRDNISSGKQPTPQEILERRYARGEITQEQFRLMRKDIK